MNMVEKPLLVRSAIRDGLPLGALFGWILSFPLYGPLLVGIEGDRASALGLLFLFVHGGGLLTLHLLPPRALHPIVIRATGALVTLVTLLYPSFASTGAWSGPTLALLGLLAAHLVLAWAPVLHRSDSPLLALATAMILANLIASVVNLPWNGQADAAWGVLAVLPLVAAYAIASRAAVPVPQPQPLRAMSNLRALIMPLVAFAVADYFVGGIWYQAAIGGSLHGSHWRPSYEAVLAAVGIALFYLRVSRSDPIALVRYALSLLGLGLLLAAAGPPGPLGVFAYRTLLLLGLVAGDLFYWHQLWRVGEVLGVRRVMGLGLGLSLCLMGLASLVTGTGTTVLLPSPLFLLLGAAILFMAIPFIFREPPAAPPVEALVLPESSPLPPTADLTPAEAAVFQLLVRGASDQEIAKELWISKHTVKFHVRNILHKTGTANRRELLSRLLSRERQGVQGRAEQGHEG